MRYTGVLVLSVFLAVASTCTAIEVQLSNATEKDLAYWNKPRITVCTNEWTPMVFCVNKTWETYTGFEIEFFRQVATKLAWPADQIDWKCLTWEDLMQDISDWGGTNGNGTCDFAVAGFAAKPDLMRSGLSFTWPTLRVGKRVMTMADKSTPGAWFFLSAISAEIWILLIISAIVIGMITWTSEVGMEALNPDTRWLSNVMWDTIGRPVGMRDYRLSSNPANLIAFTWSFLVFIIMAMYTANLTANLTTSSISSKITSLADLPGKSVGTWEFYVQDLLKYNIIAKGLPWDTKADEDAMLTALRNGEFVALVMESSMLTIKDATSCDTLLVGGIFDGVDVVAAFPRGFNNTDLYEAYNKAVIELLNEGLADRLTNQFIDVPRSPCKSAELETSTLQVEWAQVSGLWIMLGVAIGIGAILIGWRWLWKLKLKSKIVDTRCGKCCITAPSTKLNHIQSTLLHVGTGKGHTANRRTPKSAEPRISYHQADEILEAEAWASRYIGASKGFLDGSHDQDDMQLRLDNNMEPETMPDDPELRRVAFEHMVLRELALLKAELRQRGGTPSTTPPRSQSMKMNDSSGKDSMV